MRFGLLGFFLLASLLLAGGYGVGQWIRGEPSHAAPASCPSSGGGPPFSLQSFEADEARELYLDTLRLAAANQLFPDDEAFQLPTLSAGSARVADPAATIPAQILYAVAWAESKIAQAPYEVDWGTLGPPLLSFDCGYGIMQVTSTIINDGGLPSRYEALAGMHFAYNIAAGARILAEKWNEGLFPVVGEHNPHYIESWYYALWAYNGWAGINHPMHPSNDPFRVTYACDEVGRNGYPYQELVLGCIVNPPQPAGRPLWDPLPVMFPNLQSLTAPGEALDLDLFYAGLDNIYVQVAGEGPSPFSDMNMSLPEGVQPVSQPDIGQAEALRARVLGAPAGRLGIEELELTSSQLQSGDVPLEIHNDGTGLLAWRIIDAPSWLGLSIQAGVALGAYEYGKRPDPSRLRITAAAGGVPEGSHRGRITLEFHYPDGTSATESVAISLDKRGAAQYEAGRPQS